MTPREELAEALAVERFTRYRRSDKCGTYAGYQRHNYYGEKPCDDCRAAARDYQRAYRANPHVKKTTTVRNNARSRAMWRLVDLHPGDFQLLYEDELKRAGAS